MAKLKITLKKPTETLEELIDNDGLDTTQGICFSCGALRDNCEPDAENYQCDECGEFNVQGSLMCVLEIDL